MSLAPPRPMGPPLNALRAFEAAARHQSFVLAATELSVTAGAVAQQVKHLEAWAGCPLFDRKAQGVQLTARGRTLLPQLSRAFDELGLAVQTLRRAGAPQDVRIAALPSVALLWLSPRLGQLRERFPSLTFSVTALETPPNLVRDPFDLAIFFGRTGRDGTQTTVLAPSEMFPVCAPSIAKRLHAPADLARETLLHDSTWATDWPDWLTAASVADVNGESGPAFSLYSLVLDAARQGAGVMMGHAPLVASALLSRQLVRPFAQSLQREAPLCLAIRTACPDRAVQDVAHWLSTRAGAELSTQPSQWSNRDRYR